MSGRQLKKTPSLGEATERINDLVREALGLRGVSSKSSSVRSRFVGFRIQDLGRRASDTNLCFVVFSSSSHTMLEVLGFRLLGFQGWPGIGNAGALTS